MRTYDGRIAHAHGNEHEHERVDDLVDVGDGRGDRGGAVPEMTAAGVCGSDKVTYLSDLMFGGSPGIRRRSSRTGLRRAGTRPP